MTADGRTELTETRPPPDSADRPVVAAFDFDGTLTRGGSMWPFLSEVCGPARTLFAGLAVLPRLVLAALLGGRAADDAKEALLRRTLRGRGTVEIAERGADFGRRHYHRRRRPDVGARLEQHRRQGHRLVVVSASLDLYVGPAGAEIGADAVIATRLAVDTGDRLTGGYEGRNCRGEEKLARLREWVATNAPGSVLWAYGNSAGDRPLLAGADVGVDVGRLGPMGKLRAFRRLRETAELVD
jgi:phosphatidylglycerophosphatase C